MAILVCCFRIYCDNRHVHFAIKKFNEKIAELGKERELLQQQIDDIMAKRYESLEQKDPVVLDREETESLVERVICDDYVTVKNNLLRHNVLKLGMHIFGYLLENG